MESTEQGQAKPDPVPWVLWGDRDTAVPPLCPADTGGWSGAPAFQGLSITSVITPAAPSDTQLPICREFFIPFPLAEGIFLLVVLPTPHTAHTPSQGAAWARHRTGQEELPQ